MRTADLQAIVRYCDEILATSEFADYEGAVNGLQMQNSGSVSRIIAMVDATLATIRKTTERKGDLLLVHHGLFWNKTFPWTGKRYDLIKELIQGNCAVYSSHLPLDAHPEFGNNAQLARALGATALEPFILEKKQPVGVRFEMNTSLSELTTKLEQVLNGPVKLLPGGKPACSRIGVVTGGAASQIRTAAAEGVDTFITGEGAHYTYAIAEEAGINVLYGGHYNTETFGVKALGAHLSQKFGIPWEFVDYPTHL
ncbi:MAG: ybgI [Verrucomicrobiales bacterium]|nr:ybgI [Verrucomicrobiales bacterium]